VERSNVLGDSGRRDLQGCAADGMGIGRSPDVENDAISSANLAGAGCFLEPWEPRWAGQGARFLNFAHFIAFDGGDLA
jgi:hypothetical protein